MNKEKKNYGKMQGTPLHLLGSMIMATYVMGYLNIVVGNTGGIPAWLGMMVAFYFAWGNVHYRELPIKGNLPDINQQLKHLYLHYFLEYIVIWIGVKAALVFSSLWGWGSNSGLSLTEYLHALYGETLVEQWAYLFCAIFMIAFLLALYPFIYIRGNKWKLWYLIMVSLFFWILTKIVISICYIWISPSSRSNASTMSDVLNICVTPHRWQAGIYLVLAAIVALFLSYLSYKFVQRILNKTIQDKPFLWKTDKNPGKVYRIFMGLALFLTAILVTQFVLDMVRNQRERLELLSETEMSEIEEVTEMPEEPTYDKVAEFLTEDHEFGPMTYEEQFYVPVDITLNFDEDGEALGYIAYKNQNVDSAFYQLTGANILYGILDTSDTYLEMYGSDYSAFRKVSDLEEENLWKEDSIYVLWDEDWLSETSYSKDRTGYCICEKGLIETLKEKFGSVDYSTEDFSDYDAYFTIRGYEDASKAFGEEVICGDWVGCILVKDNVFYYGNKQNQITGIALQELLDILGGNHNSTIEDYQGE